MREKKLREIEGMAETLRELALLTGVTCGRWLVADMTGQSGSQGLSLRTRALRR
jgi:hypothetical protein